VVPSSPTTSPGVRLAIVPSASARCYRQAAGSAKGTIIPHPTSKELEAARRRRVADVAGPGLRVLICGINPGLYSAAVGCHFARPGNRFWKALHGAGFTRRVLAPSETEALIESGIGITNICPRATARAEDLTPRELRAGGRALEKRIRRLRPRLVAFLGIGAYRAAFARPRARPGPQPETLGGARVWVLPNPSGLNAHYGLPALTGWMKRLRAAGWEATS
jgi:TDG/mug DNA glycosylase family protein